MANCKKCGKAVGCGCGLREGLCATCANDAKKTQIVPPLVPPLPTIKK